METAYLIALCQIGGFLPRQRPQGQGLPHRQSLAGMQLPNRQPLPGRLELRLPDRQVPLQPEQGVSRPKRLRRPCPLVRLASANLVHSSTLALKPVSFGFEISKRRGRR